MSDTTIIDPASGRPFSPLSPVLPPPQPVPVLPLAPSPPFFVTGPAALLARSCYNGAMDELSLAIVGIDHANTDKAKSNRRFELLLCIPGERVQLIPEPGNRHDANAVAVFNSRGVQLGYLTAERAPFIGSRIKAGADYEAVFQGMGRHMAWLRIRFGGGAPTLPVASSRMEAQAQHGDDFFPDPDGPDWGA